MKNVIMSLAKKNVIQGFIQDDYVPTSEQQIVKYVQGRGNNLHIVECHNGETFLVSMPKKYRQMVWLRKGDCIVIDPVVEGNKVRGEINCLIPSHWVQELINKSQWPQQELGQHSDEDTSKSEEINKLKTFFQCDSKEDRDSEEDDMWPSSGDDETSEEEEESNESEEEEDKNKEDEKSIDNDDVEKSDKLCENPAAVEETSQQ